MFRFLGLHYTSWAFLLWPFRYLMRIDLRPEGLNAEGLRALTEGKHVIYVLPRMYVIDAFILNISLRRLKVPAARVELEHGKTRVASLSALNGKPKMFSKERATDLFSSTVEKMLKEDPRVEKDNIVFFPVSVFWGRSAERSGRHPVMRMLFPDDTRANSFQKILMLFVHLRNVHIHFGTPIHPKKVLEDSPDHSTAVRKMRRALMIDFNRERTAALGPQLYDLDNVARWIMKAKETHRLVSESSSNNEKTRRKISRYLSEIAANYNASTVRALEVLFDFIWTRIFNGVRVRNFDKISNVAKGGQILWMPCHRSHLDYLLLSYVLFKKGLVAPHIAAGVNLSFWPAGPILRRGGAFFLRRSIAGNRIYSHTFAQYVHFLMHGSFPVEFFQEGGRSRIGKLLNPKTGLLSWCVGSVIKRQAENTHVLPVYFGYDKVMEDDTYARELSGAKKQKESLWKLITSVRYLFSNYGRVDVSFGEPLRFGDVWKRYFSNPENRSAAGQPDIPAEMSQLGEDIDTRDARVQKFIRYLSIRVNERINSTATASGSALLTSVLVAQNEHDIERKKLGQRMVMVHSLINNIHRVVPLQVATSAGAPNATDFQLARQTEKVAEGSQVALMALPPSPDTEKIIEEIIDDGIRWKFVNVSHENKDVLKKNNQKEMNLWWYRGTIFHVLAAPSLIASFASEQLGKISLEDIALRLTLIRKIWEDELYWPIDIDSKTFAEGIFSLVIGLDADSRKFVCEFVRPERELYGIQMAVAQSLVQSTGGFSREELVKGSMALHRSAFLRGVASQPANHSKVFGTRTFDALLKAGVFVTQGNNSFRFNAESLGALQTFFSIESWTEFIS